MAPWFAAVMLTLSAASARGEEPMAVAAVQTQEATPAAAPPAAEAPAKKPTVRLRRISGTGSQILQGVLVGLDPNPQLRGELWRGTPGRPGIAQRMMTEARVGQSVSYRTAPLSSATWRFRPASKSPRDREAADYASWAFLEQLPWASSVERIVGDYSTFGFSLSEMTDDYRPVPTDRFPLHPGGGRGIVPTGLHEVPCNTVKRWHQKKDSPSQLESVVQYLPGSDVETAGEVTIPADRLLRWSRKQTGANFEGIPMLRGAFAAWKMKTAFRTIAAIKHERRGVGTPVAIAGENATDADIDAVELALAGMRANEKGELVLPNGWTFTWEGGSQSDETNIEAAISACDQEFAVNASAGFMELGLTTNSGSYALGSTQQGHYHLSIVGDSRFLSEGFNLGFDGTSPVKRIIQLNYGEDVGVPVLEARNLPTSNWSERIPLLINATNVGLITPDEPLEDELRQALEFDPHDEESARPRGTGQQPMLKTARDRDNPPPAPDPEADDDERKPPLEKEDEEETA